MSASTCRAVMGDVFLAPSATLWAAFCILFRDYILDSAAEATAVMP